MLRCLIIAGTVSGAGVGGVFLTARGLQRSGAEWGFGTPHGA